MTRHVSPAGSFFDTGVKKLATALPTRQLSDKIDGHQLGFSLVVLEPTFRLVGGGDTDPSFKAELLFMPILDNISRSFSNRSRTVVDGQ